MEKINTVEYYSSIKKNEILPFAATWMDLESITLSKISQTERQILYGIAYMRNPKNNTNEVYAKQKPTDRYRK